MKVVIRRNVQLKIFVFSVVIVTLNVILGKSFYNNLIGLIICAIPALCSYEFNFMIYMWGITGFFGLQMNGTDNFAELAVLMIMLRLLIDCKGRIRFNQFEKKLMYVCISAILLLAINIFVSYARWRQPLLTGIIVNRRLLELLGIPLYAYAARTNRIKLSDYEELLSAISSFFCVVLGIQFFLRERYELLPVQYASRRGSDLDRILFHNFAPLLCLLACIQLYKFLGNYEKKRLMRTLLYTFMLVFVANGRMLIIALLIGYLLILFLYGRGRHKWIKNFVLLFLGILVLILFAGQFVNYISNHFLADIFRASSLNENYVRIRAIKAYFNTIPNYTLLGGGVYSSNYTNAVVESVLRNRLFLSDIGIFGDVYNYGIFAAIVLLMGILGLIRVYWKSKDEIVKTSAAVTMVIIFVTTWSVPAFTYISMIVFTMMLYIREIKINNDKVYF